MHGAAARMDMDFDMDLDCRIRRWTPRVSPSKINHSGCMATPSVSIDRHQVITTYRRLKPFAAFAVCGLVVGVYDSGFRNRQS